MVESIINNLEEILNTFIDKNVFIKQAGFLNSKYSIEKFKHSIKYEILNIIDKESENYIKINLNQVYKIAHNGKQIIFYLDNDTFLTIEIKR